MRITYIHQYFKKPTEAGGSRHYEFARRLVRDGHEVTVICGGSESRRYDVDGIRVVQLSAIYTNDMSTKRRMVAMAKFMIRSIPEAVRHPADVVFATSTPLTVAVPGIVASLTRRARFVFEVRDLWPAVPYQLGILKDGIVYRAARILERLAYARSDTVIALSPGMAAGITKVNQAVPVVVVSNGSDHDLFEVEADEVTEIRRELGWDRGERVAVYAGSFGPTYDVLRWLRIASNSDRWRFIVIGAGTLSSDAHQLARKLGQDPDVILPGRMPKKQVAKYLAAADICLSSLENHPALSVNSLNKVFDSLAAGRPVAFTHDGWLPDLLTEAGAGWRLPDDPVEAARALDRLTDHQLIAAAEAARLLGHASFSRESLYQKFSQVMIGPDSRC